MRLCALSARTRTLLTLAILALASSVHADPGDFQAMPGLWKIVTRIFSHGQWSTPQVQWHCVDEGADPWAAFGQIDLPDAKACEATDRHRSSTRLTWTLTCPAGLTAHGLVGFDAAEHYRAALTLGDGQDVVQVEGKRYAACTSPSD